MPDIKSKKIIAWGASKMLEFYVKNDNTIRFDYAVDSNKALQGKVHCGLDVRSPEDLREEDPAQTTVILFPVSTTALQDILGILNGRGYLLNKNVHLYSDLFYGSFDKTLKTAIGRNAHRENYNFVKSFSLNATLPIHTTLLGNLLFLELLSDAIDSGGSIAEVGAYRGGNALLALLFLTQHAPQTPYYLFDSFEGFPEMSAFDPQDRKKGDYATEEPLERILDRFSVFNNAHVIRGFVPQTFSQLNPRETYSLVFYDCDLHDPALATFDYFWDKILPGGFLMIHDYIAERGGYTGVKQATDKFFGKKNVPIHVFWQNTAAVFVKP